MLPKSPVGRPGLCVSSVQFSPPSVDLKIPPPAPPETSCHGLRCACQNAAYNTSGFDGSSTRSEVPVESLRNSTLPQVAPPSVVLKAPRPVVPIQGAWGRDAEPATATLRPPRKIPISRHLSAAKTVESYGATWAGAERAGETSEPRARSAARRASTDKPPRADDQGTHVARKRDAPQGARA